MPGRARWVTVSVGEVPGDVDRSDGLSEVAVERDVTGLRADRETVHAIGAAGSRQGPQPTPHRPLTSHKRKQTAGSRRIWCYPLWTVGRNPFGWEPRTTEQDTERETAFVKWLATNDPDVPWDHVRDALLDPGLGAEA